MKKHLLAAIAFCMAALCSSASAQTPADWLTPQKPFRIYGNTYYVGTHGLSAILIYGPNGDILIDGGLPESAAPIAASIRALGFKLTDVKFILNSHAHYDHAGGIAELQRLTGARVLASAASAKALEQGGVGADDPQFGSASPIPKVANVAVIGDGEIVRMGSLALTAHFTPGHTPGGTSWSWTSCEQDNCFPVLYADSLTAVSSDTYHFSDHPDVLAGFEKSFATLSNFLPRGVGILLTPHPEASDFWRRYQAAQSGRWNAFMDTGAFKRYTDTARAGLSARLQSEKAAR